MSDDKKVIFSMQKLSKTYPGADKQVLKNIYLSFFYGAKIGILGLNGSGKSSLLKIIAGVDKNYQGDVVFQPGYTVGYLEQEPHLDETKTVSFVKGLQKRLLYWKNSIKLTTISVYLKYMRIQKEWKNLWIVRLNYKIKSTLLELGKLIINWKK